MVDSYYDSKRSDFEGDEHRAFIGGMWDEIGSLQFQFMLSKGLKPSNTLIDVGCGCLRGGVKFIDYLEPHKYFGVDINEHLIHLGLEKELDEQNKHKISLDNFRVTNNFEFDFGVESFDFGIALSLFTHLSSASIEKCLSSLRSKFNGGRFYATFFLNEEEKDVEALEQKMGIVTYSNQDPYHYTKEQILEMAEKSGWKANIIGQFNHPRNQQMVEFVG